MFNTPILYLIFNRTDLTEITFSSICKIKPKKLFIAADGPRFGNVNDEINCKLVREYVLSKIDWDCEVNTLFREKNLGCGIAVSSAISWFFTNVEAGIILEDDCLPNESFFYFCENLLLKYNDDLRINHISGFNFQLGYRHKKIDYFFSNYTIIWGWATWKRSWVNYDFNMIDFEFFYIYFKNKNLISHSLFLDVKNKIIDTWDIQWQYINLKNKNISIQPNISLVRNIGFSKNATHTYDKEPYFLKITEYGELKNNLNHPSIIKINWLADFFTAYRVYNLNQLKIVKVLINNYYKYLLKRRV
jgi:hypothetical protein